MKTSTKIYKLLIDCNVTLKGPVKVLDLGCGNGNLVKELTEYGVDIVGCDIGFKSGEYTENLLEIGVLKKINMAPEYSLPFEDSAFDIVLSNQVFEHVQDHDVVLGEIHRVTKPGGCGLHVFPVKLRYLEVHTGIPLGGLISAKWWIYIWSFLGINRRNPDMKDWKIIGQLDFDYIRKNTNYLTESELFKLLEKHKFDYTLVNKKALNYSSHKFLRLMVRFPYFDRITSIFGAKFLFINKI